MKHHNRNNARRTGKVNILIKFTPEVLPEGETRAMVIAVTPKKGLHIALGQPKMCEVDCHHDTCEYETGSVVTVSTKLLKIRLNWRHLSS